MKKNVIGKPESQYYAQKWINDEARAMEKAKKYAREVLKLGEEAADQYAKRHLSEFY